MFRKKREMEKNVTLTVVRVSQEGHFRHFLIMKVSRALRMAGVEKSALELVGQQYKRGKKNNED